MQILDYSSDFYLCLFVNKYKAVFAEMSPSQECVGAKEALIMLRQHHHSHKPHGVPDTISSPLFLRLHAELISVTSPLLVSSFYR